MLSLFAALITGAALAAPKPGETGAAPFSAMPIKEITVFKDGYAYVAHEGEMPVDGEGNVVMDYLPAPVLGTFWPFASDSRAKLLGVVAGHKRIQAERTALTLREQLEANVGADVIISEGGTNQYAATIAGLPERSTEELAAAAPPNASESLPEKGNLIFLQTAAGLKVMPLERIQDVIFKSTHHRAVTNEEFRDLLTLRLDWGKSKPATRARVGLFYLQKGVRWIPNYRVELDGQGHAALKLQGELLNDLADLEDASVNLVVGVPTFVFKDSLDPIALQKDLAQVSQRLQPDSSSPLAYSFSNSLMSQMARPDFGGSSRQPVSEGGSLGPDIGDSGQSEDLFVYTVPHVTLRKGERLVLTIADFELPYEDVFTLDLPLAPPPQLRANFNLNSEQQRELDRLFNAPKVMHKIRLSNRSKYPLTTAPALLLERGRVLAQALMTYAAPGATVDLPLTTAVDIQARKSDFEVKRTPRALHENGTDYDRLDMGGTITLTNHRGRPATLEVTRSLIGSVESADHGGKAEKLDLFDEAEGPGNEGYPFWWNWYNSANWSSSLNGVSRITWKLTLEAGNHSELGYQWYYFAR